MKTIKANDPQVIDAYRNGNDDQRKVLTSIFGHIETPNDAKELWEAFLKQNKLTHALPHTWEAAESDSFKRGDNAFSMLQLIVSNENGDWAPNWDDTNEKKWSPIFDMGSGGGFSDAGYGGWFSVSFVGSRLCFKTEKKTIEIATKYWPIYKMLLFK